jgi:hypothetical protein
MVQFKTSLVESSKEGCVSKRALFFSDDEDNDDDIFKKTCALHHDVLEQHHYKLEVWLQTRFPSLHQENVSFTQA